MKIVNIIGGLGNQMFQYAFALALKHKFPNEDILIDTSHFNYLFVKKVGSANLHNGFEIPKVFPNANLNIATPRQLMHVSWYIPNYLLSRVGRKFLPKRKHEYVQSTKDFFEYKEDVFDLEGNAYYEGNWESISYLLPIKDELLRTFSHPVPSEENASYIKKMSDEASVGIHVRRGDYLQHPNFAGVCELDYYKKAISEILSDGEMHCFYIFSNDMQWCRDNIMPLVQGNEIVFMTENTGKNSCWDMFLMTYCRDLIIANSTFSWWGAFLNKMDGRIIAPKKWMNREAKFDIWSPDWIKV